MNFLNLDNKIQNYCEEKYISCVIRVTVGGESKYSKTVGLANINKNTEFTNDSMFTFYSLSKPFCAIGLLKLYDKGLVDIDTHPSKYVSETQGLHKDVTIRHLLHHVSGLPDFEQNAYFCQKYAPGYAHKTREHLKLLTKYPSYFAPETNAMYANINFILCALIIENISGLSYAEYMQKEVFMPLGMKTAVVDNENLFIPNRVQGYTLENNVLKETDKSHDWLLGAGDIVGTVDDVYCLNKAIKNKLLLKEETWNEVLTPHPLNSMGMGCTVSTWHGKKRITHNGGHYGFRTLHIQLPEDDFDIILLSNSGFGDARNDISEMVYSAFYGNDDIKSDTVSMDKGYI